MQYTDLLFIQRGQGPHLGQMSVIDLALSKADRVHVLYGSANRHISTKNPWTFEQRRDMLRKVYPDTNRVNIVPLNDFPNDTAWLAEVHDIADRETRGDKVGIIGFNKDYTSRYLKLFPTFGVELVPSQFGTLNSTQIRKQFFQKVPIISEFIPGPIRDDMKKFAFTDQFKWLLKEFEHIQEYKEGFKHLPYPPIFVTADNVVIQAGHILLVTRKKPPFAGCLALPGGFVNANERTIDAATRELREETRISDMKGLIPREMLKSFITESKVFDDPDRSDRGRTITHAYKYMLPKSSYLYHVRGDDDAEFAKWYELSTLKMGDFMEDHGFIIEEMAGVKLK